MSQSYLKKREPLKDAGVIVLLYLILAILHLSDAPVTTSLPSYSTTTSSTKNIKPELCPIREESPTSQIRSSRFSDYSVTMNTINREKR